MKERLTRLVDKAVMTAAQGALLAVGSESIAANALEFDWSTIGGFALGGAFLAVATNLARDGITGAVEKRVNVHLERRGQE